MNEQMDPDNDGFNLSFEEAEKLNKNMNILHYIRKHILSNNSKLFYNGLNSLIESTFPQNYNVANTSLGNTSNNYIPYLHNLPAGWDCANHDKGLLNAVADNGLSYLNNLSNSPNYNFDKMSISYDEGLNRINYLCEFFRDFTSGNKNKKKTPSGFTTYENNISNNNLGSNFNQSGNTLNNYNNNINNKTQNNLNSNNNNSLSISNNYNNYASNDSNNNINNRKKISKLIINKDEKGNILYPINVNSSLKILNLGKICWDKAAYHTEKNLFPIGFKSVREHSSMKNLGERALYTCEILDGGNKPLYKLIPHEDPENPILKESSTGCWVNFLYLLFNLFNNYFAIQFVFLYDITKLIRLDCCMQ